MEEDMRTSIKSVMFAAAVFSFSGAASAECYKVSGLGTGATEGIAQFMAAKALKDSIANRGLKAAGGQSMSCTANTFVVTNCTAAQRACK
jgi:hypothetical protein